MPRQNTRPTDFPPAVQQQIARLAECIVAARKALGETQAQWAARLGISQPTMARLERGDASVSAATYILCLSQLNPQLDLTVLLPRSAASAPAAPAPAPAKTAAAPATPSAATGVDDFVSLLASWAPASV
ncbi:helix-turn-helix domain-containing protein [Comamonas terrigena]|uniref:helix-turn-helix domain-containing protein n=1 Tax=Comamonas terrigena TaxID=32013 RepID=UPI002449CF2E|nr:helix-turn-helix transcriptional regulator [Comamonas terrigena]MDH1704034.1 helix-turn-helix domain-containing protein [Comamonas terrigena]